MNILVIFVISDLFSVGFGHGPPKLQLHLRNENRSITLRGDQCGGGAVFDSQDVSCVCMTGLWVFYQRDCSLPHVILGATNGQCFNLDFKVHKASLISPVEETPFTSSATAFDRSITSIGGKFVTAKGIPPTIYFVPSGFPVVITTGQQSWRIPHKNICMKPISLDSNVTNYCLFKHSTYEEHQLLDAECSINDHIISPLVCTPYLSDTDSDAQSCIDVEVIGRPREKRSISVVKKKRSPKQQGRVFLGAVQGLGGGDNSTNGTSGGGGGGGGGGNGTTGGGGGGNDPDENGGLVVTIDRPIINSEIWNYMTFRAQVRLGIRDPRVGDKGMLAYSPSFEFLQVAKQIQQKACPDHYVSDEHYDISVGAFESVQKNHLRYMDAYLDFSTSERIMDALNACLMNITTYPFLERVSKKAISCNGSAPITHGSYEMFDQILELNLGHDQGARANEPIVETVWKVFVHAHSACFPYFKHSLNDHHRFTTVMLPLFTNEINDMWFSVPDLQPDVYTGFLGDAVDLMDSVSYCAMFSRLESPYPWDLPRPKKDNARRRKRQVSEGYIGFECMEDYDARNVCPISEETLPFLQDEDSFRINDPSFTTSYH